MSSSSESGCSALNCTTSRRMRQSYPDIKRSLQEPGETSLNLKNKAPKNYLKILNRKRQQDQN